MDQYIENSLHYFEGLARLAAEETPLWIFSLNHDLIVECLAAKYEIPLNSGFPSGEISLPRRDQLGAKIGNLKAESITAEQLAQGLPFFPRGVTSIYQIRSLPTGSLNALAALSTAGTSIQHLKSGEP